MSNEGQAPSRAIVYCIVPAELAERLHEPLRRHFREDPGVEIVIEQRWRDRRRRGERRGAAPDENSPERRRVRAASGRRVGDRRAPAVAVEPPADLPRRVRPHAARLVWLECLEPSSERAEDHDTARLVTRFQAGEREVFGEIYMRYFDRVYAYLRVAVKDVHTAEDLTQHVFANVLDALPRYERRGSRPFRAWLFVIVRNAAINQLRQDRRSESVAPGEIDRQRDEPQDLEIDLGALRWVSDRELVMFVGRLPAVQQQVLLLRFQLDMTTAEIADVLGRTADDVRGLQSRALRFLGERLTVLGRAPGGTSHRIRSRVFPKYAPVLRGRRFALH